jgi:hypothetical protein
MIDTNFPLPHSLDGELGQNNESCGDVPGSSARLLTMEPRSRARLAIEAVRVAIGAELKKLYFHVLREPIPAQMAELLKQLDSPQERCQNIDDS